MTKCSSIVISTVTETEATVRPRVGLVSGDTSLTSSFPCQDSNPGLLPPEFDVVPSELSGTHTKIIGTP